MLTKKNIRKPKKGWRKHKSNVISTHGKYRNIQSTDQRLQFCFGPNGQVFEWGCPAGMFTHFVNAYPMFNDIWEHDCTSCDQYGMTQQQMQEIISGFTVCQCTSRASGRGGFSPGSSTAGDTDRGPR